MKNKITIALVALMTFGSIGFANAALEKLVKEKTGADVKVVKSMPLEELKNMQLVVLESGNQRVPFYASADGTTIIGTDSSFLTSKDALLGKLQLAMQDVERFNNRSKSDKLLADIKGQKLPVISLQSGTKTNKTLYIVSDPNCPYCQDELDKIDDRLKGANVKMVVVGILSENSLSKATDIYTQIKNAKNNQAKINVLRKIYSQGYQTNTQPSKEAVGVTEAVRNSGITAVPYKFEIVE